MIAKRLILSKVHDPAHGEFSIYRGIGEQPRQGRIQGGGSFCWFYLIFFLKYPMKMK